MSEKPEAPPSNGERRLIPRLEFLARLHRSPQFELSERQRNPAWPRGVRCGRRIMYYSDEVAVYIDTLERLDPPPVRTASPKPVAAGAPPSTLIERNRRIEQALAAGEKQATIAARFGLSPQRVCQLNRARRQNATGSTGRDRRAEA